LDDHPAADVPDSPLWSENYATVCFDPAHEIGMMMHLGRWWGDPTIWRETISLALPGDRIVCIKNYGRAATPTVASGSMFRVEVLQPGRRFRFTYDGPAAEHPRSELMKFGCLDGIVQPCRIDLVFDAAAPPWDMAGHSTSSAAVAGSLHIEQVGHGDGIVDFAGQRYHIERAFMNRDHSRGFRDMAQFKRHCWAQGYFADADLTFNVYAVDLFGQQEIAMARATISQGDRRLAATIADIELISGVADARQPYRIHLDTEIGDIVLTKSETVTSAPISFTSPWELHHGVTPGTHSALTFEEGVRWDWDGRRGTGWSERAFIHEPFSRPPSRLESGGV
jgi:hypothetical protein